MFKLLSVFLALLLSGCGTAIVKIELPEEIASAEAANIKIGLCEERLTLNSITAGSTSDDRAFNYTYFLRQFIKTKCVQPGKNGALAVSPGVYYLAIAYIIPKDYDKYSVSPDGEISRRHERGYWQDKVIILNSTTIKVTTKTRDGVTWR